MRAPKGRKWTTGDLSMLRQLAFRAPRSTIATALDRSVLSIRTKAAPEQLPLQDDLSGLRRAPLVAAPAHRRPPRVGNGDAPLQPEPGDYVVAYERRPPSGNPSVTIVCVSDRPEPMLIRATFSSAEEAGRFESQARQMAAAVGTRCFRSVDGGRYTLLDGVNSEGDD